MRRHYSKKPGCSMKEKELTLKFGLKHRFDGVSVSHEKFDGRVVAEISSATLASKDAKAMNRYHNTKKLRLLEDLFFLLVAEAKEKYLILTDRNIFDAFKKQFGKFADKNEIKMVFYTQRGRKEAKVNL